MLFLIKSDFIEHLFFYFCFLYRSLQLLFKPNQTQKKKKYQIPENKLPEIYFAVDPCPPFSATNHKKIHTYKYSCWRLWIPASPICASNGVADLASSSPTTAIDASQDCAVARSRSVREIASSRDRDVDRDLAFARSRRREIATLIAISPSRDHTGKIAIRSRDRAVARLQR